MRDNRRGPARIAWTDEEARGLPRYRSDFVRKMLVGSMLLGSAVVTVGGSVTAFVMTRPATVESVSTASVATAAQVAQAETMQPKPPVVEAAMKVQASTPPAGKPAPLVVAAVDTTPSRSKIGQVVAAAGAGKPTVLTRDQKRQAARDIFEGVLTGQTRRDWPKAALAYGDMPVATATPWSVALGSAAVVVEDGDVSRAAAVTPAPAAVPAPAEAEVAAVEPEAVPVPEAKAKDDRDTVKVRRSVSMRVKPNGKVLKTLKRGTEIVVLEKCKDWCAVEADGRKGYVWHTYVGRS